MRQNLLNLRIFVLLHWLNMKKMIRVEGEKNLYRDTSSGAIINTDEYEYSQYIKQRERRNKEKQEILELKNELSEIKTLLVQLLKNES